MDAIEVLVLWTAADVARALDVSKQAISNRYARGTMPAPTAVTYTGQHPLWSERVLRSEGVLK